MAKKGMSIEESLKAAMAEVSEEEDTAGVETTLEETDVIKEPEVETPAVEEEATTEEVKAEGVRAEGDSVPEPEEEDEWEPAKCLTEDERAEFKALPKELKPMADRFIRRRDLSMQRWVNKVRQEAGEYVQQSTAPIASILQVIEPHMDRLKLERKDLASTFDSLLEWDKNIENNPTDAIAQLCKLKNVSPRMLFDYMNGDGVSQQDTPQSSGSPDPRLDTVLEKLEALEARNRQLEEGTVRNQWGNVVSQIAASRNEAGEPIYPYYEDVRQEMSQWTRMIGAQNPQLSPQQLFHAAYEKACWSNESVRAILLQEKQTRSVTAGLKKKQAASSLPASSSNGVGSKSPKTPPGGNLSIEESLRLSIDQLGYEF